MFFTSCWERVGSFAAYRHFVGEVGTGRGLSGVRRPPGLGWLTVSLCDCKGTALPGPVSPVQGDAWKIPSWRLDRAEFKSQLLLNLQCDLGQVMSCF